jgi:multiple sugar transport system ATP-binding protein
MARIRMEGLTKRYPDGTEAVKGIDLVVEDGEFMVLVGPSGCGKSTLLNMIAGLEDVTEGSLYIGDDLVNNKAPKDRNIAMVFQNYALYPHMTVRENMAFPLKLARLPREEIDKRVQETARILDLTEHLDRKPANLSGGQRQRVAMGRAIVRQPSVFLMDEPLSNLDAKLRVQMRIEVSRLQHRLGTTTVYVTHDQTEAMTLGDRVAVMRKGTIQQVDTPRDLYENPANLFVAGFIGSPGMNFVVATVEGGQVRMPFASFAAPEGLALPERVIVGLRPEHFEDASLVPEDERDAGIVFTAHVDVVESVGSDLYAYLLIEASEVGIDSVETPEIGAGQIVARLSGESRVGRDRDAELWFDPRKALFFDPDTTENLSPPVVDLTERAAVTASQA